MDRLYHIDGERFPLHKLQESLRTRRLIPSRQILKENLDENFASLAAQGVNNLSGLLKILAGKNTISKVAAETGIPIEYLNILRREAASYFPNPVNLAKFPGDFESACGKLAAAGIKTTKQLFTAANSPRSRNKLAEDAGIETETIRRLFKLADLTRLYGVGPVFARLLLDAGIDSVEKFSRQSPGDIIKIYEKNTGKKADFPESDIEFSLDLAGYLV